MHGSIMVGCSILPGTESVPNKVQYVKPIFPLLKMYLKCMDAVTSRLRLNAFSKCLICILLIRTSAVDSAKTSTSLRLFMVPNIFELNLFLLEGGINFRWLKCVGVLYAVDYENCAHPPILFCCIFVWFVAGWFSYLFIIISLVCGVITWLFNVSDVTLKNR